MPVAVTLARPALPSTPRRASSNAEALPVAWIGVPSAFAAALDITSARSP